MSGGSGSSGGRAERLTSDRVRRLAAEALARTATLVAWAQPPRRQPRGLRRAGGRRRRRPGSRTGTTCRTRVLGWTADGRVVASTRRCSRSAHARGPTRCRSTAAPRERLPYGPINGLARRADGATVLQSTINREPATWKRYRGGTAPEALARPRRQRRVRALPGRARRAARRPGLVRRAARVRVRPRGPRQRLLGAGRRHRPAPAQRPHRQLRPRSGRRPRGRRRPGSSTSAPGELYRLDSTRRRRPAGRRSRSSCPARASAGSRPSPPVDRSLGDAEVLSVDATGRASVGRRARHRAVADPPRRPGARAGRHTPACAPGCRGCVPGRAGRRSG